MLADITVVDRIYIITGYYPQILKRLRRFTISSTKDEDNNNQIRHHRTIKYKEVAL